MRTIEEIITYIRIQQNPIIHKLTAPYPSCYYCGAFQLPWQEKKDATTHDVDCVWFDITRTYQEIVQRLEEIAKLPERKGLCDLCGCASVLVYSFGLDANSVLNACQICAITHWGKMKEGSHDHK